MGIYLNSTTAFSLYKNERKRPYFVDKTMLLTELIPLAEQGNSHICITRPRRFGKTIMANMIGAFFGKGYDSSELFGDLKIARQDGYQENRNQYNVIHIDFSKAPEKCESYGQYIERIEKRLIRDLKKAYPESELDAVCSSGDAFDEVFAAYDSPKFLFVLDEWDSVFHMSFMAEQDKKSYLLFLKGLLKDKPYVSLAYMTGVLPISKYSSGSELNMFLEYTMVNEIKFNEYFGFTDAEVDMLYARYCENVKEPEITREKLQEWYDGYYTKAGKRIYNPRSVVCALTNNNLGNYWTSSGPYDEIYYYVKHNIDDVRNDLALMLSGEEVSARIQEYAAVSMELSTKDEIFSAMVVYGFLRYADGKVSIPNKELMGKFDDMISRKPDLGYVYRLAKESERMLEATLAGDTDTMSEILSAMHA